MIRIYLKHVVLRKPLLPGSFLTFPVLSESNAFGTWTFKSLINHRTRSQGERTATSLISTEAQEGKGGGGIFSCEQKGATVSKIYGPRNHVMSAV